MPIYYFEYENGSYCGLYKAQTIQQAQAEIKSNVSKLRVATKDDLAWVRAMFLCPFIPNICPICGQRRREKYGYNIEEG
jgi:hypothetical protein